MSADLSMRDYMRKLNRRSKIFEKAMGKRREDFTVMIVGHTYIQSLLNELLETMATVENVLEKTDVQYPALCAVLAAFGGIEADLLPILSKLGAYRNKYAHSLDFQLTETQKSEFYALLPTRIRESGRIKGDGASLIRAALFALSAQLNYAIAKFHEEIVRELEASEGAPAASEAEVT